MATVRIDSNMNPKFVLYNLVFGNLTDNLCSSNGKINLHNIKQKMDSLGLDMSEDEIGYSLYEWAVEGTNGLTLKDIDMSVHDYHRYHQRKYGQFPQYS